MGLACCGSSDDRKDDSSKLAKSLKESGDPNIKLADGAGRLTTGESSDRGTIDDAKEAIMQEVAADGTLLEGQTSPRGNQAAAEGAEEEPAPPQQAHVEPESEPNQETGENVVEAEQEEEGFVMEVSY